MAFGIPNIERIVSNFLEGGRGITAIRSLEIDKRFLWVVDFVPGVNSIQAPSPFDDLFPASDVNIPVATLNTDTVTFGQGELPVPKNESARDLNITFYDSPQRALLRWFYDWINLDIKNNGAFMSGVNDNHQAVASDSFGQQRRVYPTRQLRLTLLDAYKSEVSVYNYQVFPKDNIDFSGSQVSEATQYTVNFAIVEDLSFRPISSSFGGFSFQTVLDTIGRFL